MAIIRLLVISSVLSVACGNYNLDPARDPVRQRLEIPAHPVFVSDYVSGGQQHSRKKSRGIPNVVVEADHPFSLTLPQDSIPGHIITHRKVSGRDGKPLPPWILYDPVSLTLHGEPSVSDAGGWTVQVDDVTADDRQLIRDVFTIQVEPYGPRTKRQALQPEKDSQPEGSADGEDADGDDSDDIPDDAENIVPDSRIVPSLTSPVFGTASSTPVLKAYPGSSASSSKIVRGSSSITADIRPTKLSPSMSMTESAIEPTPVLTEASLVVPPLLQSSSAYDDNDDVNNGTRNFDPPQPTLIEATPPLPADDIDDNGILPNLIEDDDEDKKARPPQVRKRLQTVQATAGKVFRFLIPAETFSNGADGDTRTLDLKIIPNDSESLNDMQWIGFDDEKQEIYGLPLGKDIGTYLFTVQARNGDNLTVSEEMKIRVLQHQADRTFVHRFVLQLRPELTDEEKMLPQIYWLVHVIGTLGRVLGVDEETIVVRNMSDQLKSDLTMNLTWSDEKLPKRYCPEDEIKDIYHKLTDNDKGEVIQSVDDDFFPQILVERVFYILDGLCQPMPTTPIVSVESTGKNVGKLSSAPILRNPVDHVDAKVGLLFRFQVPEDAFYDEEDGSTRRMSLNLKTIDHQQLEKSSWLQFDGPNQEFYGVPLSTDVGSEEYQLVCTDSSGQTATDGLVVRVEERPKTESQMLEFIIKIDMEFATLSQSAHRKVRLISALADLFEDEDTSNVVIHSFEPETKPDGKGTWTIVRWRNATLVGQTCLSDDVMNRLRQVLIDNDGKVSSRCKKILSAADFVPEEASLLPLGDCLGSMTPTHQPGVPNGTLEEVSEGDMDATWADDYLLTFIVPGIIITLMLLLAAVIACVLYRRRRTGKLGLEERRGFVSKGIPIIFAEELEERPSGRHPAKAPVILKEEKSSQPPPDYHKMRSSTSPYPAHKGTSSEQRDLLRTAPEDVEDEQASLYQPPPPVSASRESSRYSRPKATPAYRKPPPYVPP